MPLFIYICASFNQFMNQVKTEKVVTISFSEKLKCYAQILKLKITIFVVLSAVFGYFIGATSYNFPEIISLIIGGFLVTGSANTFNQIIERDYDKLMKRTQSRPLPQNKLNVNEVIAFAFISGVIGISVLWVFLNPLSGILGVLAIFMYAAVYTPLKRVSPYAVFVGAFPGAIPPMLGLVASTGSFGFEAGMLFAIQFLWQFPHFWAIAWRLHGEYQKAGFKMLPFDRKDKKTSVIIFISSLLLFASSFLPEYFNVTGRIATVGLFVFSSLMVIPAFKLMQTQDDKYALRVMLMSYLYLILSLLFILVDKV